MARFIHVGESELNLGALCKFSDQGEGGSRKPPFRCGKKDPWWCQSQGLSSSRRPQVDALV